MSSCSSVESSTTIVNSRTYQYQPLAHPDSIRLIDLQPSPNLEDKVRCKIIHTTLSECDHDQIDHYTALSYVWGDPEQTAKIAIEGCNVDVTVNLDTALRHMRDSTRPRRIWADAICINQNDYEEKGHQVAQMFEVYRTAQHTIIYLGESTPGLDEWMRILTDENSALKQALRKSPRCPANFPDEFQIIKEQSAILFQRPWFTRVWVLQELVFSKDPWIQIGRGRVRWDDIALFLKATDQWNRYSVFTTMNASRKDRLQKTLGIGGEENSLAGNLLKTLIERRGFGARDPRDMIFAHLSFCTSGEEIVPDILSANYTKTTKQVYEETAGYILEQTDDFVILAQAEEVDPSGRNTPLATWCPNSTKKSVPKSILFMKYPTGLLGQSEWNSLSKLISPSTFACYGFVVCAMTSVSGKIEPSVKYDGFHVNGEFINKEERDGWFEDRISSNWSAFLDPGIKQHDFDDTKSIPLRLSSYPFPILQRIEDFWNRDDIEALRGRRFARLLFSVEYEEEEVHPSEDGSGSPTIGNQLPYPAINEKAEPLSQDQFLLVPGATRPGDILCLLGANTQPFILRPYVPDSAIEALARNRVGESFMTSEAFPPYGGLSRIKHFTVVGQCSAPYSEPKYRYIPRAENMQEGFVLQHQYVIVLH